MAHYTFDISGIYFADAADKFNLEYPVYPDLFNYTGVNRGIFQLDPAFQFVAPNKTDTYCFNLFLDPNKGAEFSKLNYEDLRCASVGSLPPPCLKINFMSPHHCQITVNDIAGWGLQKLTSLRIYCSEAGKPDISNTGWGVCLSLLTPGGSSAMGPERSCDPADPKLSIGVKLVTGLPDYSIYNYRVNPFPMGMTLEPAFRLSEARNEVGVELVLLDNNKIFPLDRSTNDDVAVFKRSPMRPLRLSKVAHARLDHVAVKFRYAMESPHPTDCDVFGFYLQVNDGIIIGAAPPSCHHPPAFAHVDPIMMHDPPPRPIT